MPLEYVFDTDAKELTEALGDYTQWFSRLTRAAFYPDADTRETLFSYPGSFLEWIKKAAKESSVSEDILRQLQQLDNDLRSRVDGLARRSAESGAPPCFEDFDALATSFERLTGGIMHVQQDMLLKNSGFDFLSGVRNRGSLHRDLEIEMERLARQGQPFSVALVVIDDLKAIYDSAEDGKKQGDDIVRSVAKLIKRCLRSFDDAYRLDDNEFILALKQTGLSGGMRALERLKMELEENRLTYRDGGQTHTVTLSCCVAEPLPNDGVESLISSLRADLVNIEESQDVILEHHEMSPLQRYIKSGEA